MNFRVFFLIISGVVGSGIFFIPYNLSNFGVNSFISLFLISCLFAYIGSLFGNIKESIFSYIDKIFGRKVGFFTAWIYWIIAWSSTIVVIAEMFRYFVNIFPFFAKFQSLTQVCFVLVCIVLNLFKNKYQVFIENTVNILKITPLLIIPIFVFFSNYFNIETLTNNQTINSKFIFSGLPKMVWCFLGVECGSMINEKKNLKKTIIFSIFIVSLIYALNLISCFGVLSYDIKTYTPFANMMEKIFGVKAFFYSSLLVFLVTLGALNTWIISGSAVALESSQVGYFPKILQNKNRFNSEYISLLVSSIGLIPLCFFSTNNILIEGVDLASNNILLFYAVFVIAYGVNNKDIIAKIIGSSVFLLFCYFLSIKSLILLLVLIIIGIPVYKKNQS